MVCESRGQNLQRVSGRLAHPEPIMDREAAFVSALHQASGFEVTGERMSCLDADRNLLVEFVASEVPVGK